MERRPSPETGSPASSSPEPPVGDAPAPTPEHERSAPEVDSTPSGSAGRLAVAVLAYVGARLLVVAVIAGVLTLVGLPLLLALLIAVVVALPLSLVLFRGLRARLAREADAATAERRERRARLRAELRGDSSPGT